MKADRKIPDMSIYEASDYQDEHEFSEFDDVQEVHDIQFSLKKNKYVGVDRHLYDLITSKAKQRHISEDALIQELAQRYKENKSVPQPETDGWTSSVPLSIAFLDVSGNNVNDAEIDFILNSTGEKLRESKRYQDVEREMIDKLLQELNPLRQECRHLGSHTQKEAL